MFGKFFASTFTGSMMAAGAEVFAVWGYVIAHAVESRVELNARLLAAVIGAPVDAIEGAIEKLCAPDPHSRSAEHDGRRLIKEGQYQYFVTGHQKYRHMRDEADRRDYNRVKKQESRARQALTQCQSMSNTMSTMSANTEAEAEAEKKTSSSKAAQRPKAKARRKCPEEFVVSSQLIAWADGAAPLVNINAETDAFRDWTFSTARVDWDGTWRNWMRKAQQSAEQRGAKRAAVSFKKSDDDRLAERVREMTGGIVSPSNQGEVIDMEAANEFKRIEAPR